MVETARLPAAERTALEQLVRTSGFFALPARAGGVATRRGGAGRGGTGPGGAGPARPLPDARQLDIEVQDDAGRRHSVSLPEHATSEALRDLVDRAWEAAGDPGPQD